MGGAPATRWACLERGSCGTSPSTEGNKHWEGSLANCLSDPQTDASGSDLGCHSKIDFYKVLIQFGNFLEGPQGLEQMGIFL